MNETVVSPAPTRRLSLHEQRYAQERLVYAIDTLLEAVNPSIDLFEKIQSRKCMVAQGATMERISELSALRSLGEFEAPVRDHVRAWRG